MRVACIGGGPGGLYLAILLKRWACASEVTVYERNARGQTDGWGIVYWADLLAELQRADPESASAIRDASLQWAGQALMKDGREVRRADSGGYAMSRHRMLEILAERATEVGVNLRYETEINDLRQFADADLVAACDGAGSAVRKTHEDVFRPQTTVNRNKYIWLGVKRPFEPFTFGFVGTAAGYVWFHAYTFGAASTCIVECAPETWAQLGFDRISPDEAAVALSGIFARELTGQELMAGDSSWQSFRTVRNETWVNARTVLLGDAAHTAHFSVGSGTKLALEDAISLASALRRQPDIDEALQAYDQERRAAVARTQQEASASAAWFDDIERFANLPDEQFFALLLHRRSRLLTHMPPQVFWILYRAARRFPLIGTLWRQTGRWRHSLRKSPARAAATARLDRQGDGPTTANSTTG